MEKIILTNLVQDIEQFEDIMSRIKIPGETCELAEGYVAPNVVPMSKYEASFKLMNTYLKPAMQSSEVITDPDFKKVHKNVEFFILSEILWLYHIYRTLQLRTVTAAPIADAKAKLQGTESQKF